MKEAPLALEVRASPLAAFQHPVQRLAIQLPLEHHLKKSVVQQLALPSLEYLASTEELLSACLQLALRYSGIFVQDSLEILAGISK